MSARNDRWRLDARRTISAASRSTRNFGDKVETQLPRKRRRRPRCRARHRALRPLRLRHHLHDVVRLHGPDRQGRRQVPGCEVRARHRLQDRPRTSRPTIRASMKAAMSRARSRRRCRRPAWRATSPPSRSRKSCRASTPSYSARSRSIPTSSSRSSGSTPGSTPARKPMPPRPLIDQGVDIITQHTDSTGADAGRRGAGHQGLRPGFRHDQGRPEGAADRDRRQLGRLLHQAHPRPCSTAPGSRSRAGTA